MTSAAIYTRVSIEGQEQSAEAQCIACALVLNGKRSSGGRPEGAEACGFHFCTAGIVGYQMNVDNAVSRAGLEPDGPQDKAQLIDSVNRQKRSNRSFRQFEVHGGYTGYEFVSRYRERK